MRSVMSGSHSFAQVASANIQRSLFDRSFGYKTTFNAGYLIPFFAEEALPGDTQNLRATVFARLATPIAPTMDNLFCETFFFFVPNRLIWENWEKFNGAQDNPGDSVSFLVPQVKTPGAGSPGGALVGSMADYFGIPTQVPDLYVDALHFRAYNLIYNTWFRDENLQNSVTVPTGDGPDTYSTYSILRRGKRHDYFTSALPWPQKGPTVSIPLGTWAPIVGTGTSFSGTAASGNYINVRNESGALRGIFNQASGGSFIYGAGSATGTSELKADLSQATAASINALRQAMQVQGLYERDARGGTRYTEILRAHFGVVSPDQRLQRPEYLGGGSTRVSISPIAQTSAVPSQPTPQGNLAAMGTMSFSGHGFTKSFVEHGVLIGLLSVRADLTYQQGLNRMWSRQTRFDFFWPALAHLGEQTILNKEIYAQGSVNSAADAAAFGYAERYAEYRFKPSLITGQFRSTYATPLDHWHYSQEFDTLPALNATFIEDNPPIARTVAVPSQPNFLLDAYFSYRCARPIPTNGTPVTFSRF